MKIERGIKFNVELDEAEIMKLDEAIKVLQRIQEAMEEHNCDTLMCCCSDYTYEISEVKDVIYTLKQFEDISEIFR